jgi:hypothetical protein
MSDQNTKLLLLRYLSVSLVIFNEDKPQEDEMPSVHAKQAALWDARRKDSTDPQDMLGEPG